MFLFVCRFSQLWDEELAKRGPEKASVGRVVFKFVLSRVVTSSILALFALSLRLLSAVSIVSS